VQQQQKRRQGRQRTKEQRRKKQGRRERQRPRTKRRQTRKERVQQRKKHRQRAMGKRRRPRVKVKQRKEQRRLVGKILGLDKRIRQQLVERDRWIASWRLGSLAVVGQRGACGDHVVGRRERVRSGYKQGPLERVIGSGRGNC
jgi:hypothetical protein